MGILLRLMAKIVFLLVQFTLKAGLEVLGCIVRLLYWSVRTYGWGRVAAFFLALWLSVWVHQQLGSPFTLPASLGSIAFVTFSFWGIMVGGYLWLARRWQQGVRNWSVRTSPQSRWNSHAHAPSNSPAPQRDSLSLPTSLTSGALPSQQAVLSPCGTSLWEQVLSLTTLKEAWRRVLVRGGSPGLDGMTVETFALQAEQHLQRLAMELAENRYQPYPPRWVEVPKRSGGVRRLAILCVRDRIVQLALHIVLSSLWNKCFAPCSYAYRPGRSALQAVAAVERARAVGKVWVVDADIESFFDSVPHAPLFALLEDWLPDEKVRQLVRLCVTATAPAQGRGIAQGAPLSPLLANLYLHPFDEALSQAGYSLIRYADDFVILCATRLQAEEALQRAERLLNGLGLRLNANKTRIVHWDDGFTFLGYVFTKDGKFPSEEAIASLQERLASTDDEMKRRQILAGWKGYFGDSLPDFDPSLLSHIVTEEPVDTIDDAPWWSQEDESDRNGTSSQIGLYRERFLGRPDVFARYWQTKGRKGYAPVRRPVSDEELVAHLQGQIVLGTYLLHPDGTTKALVIDIDGPESSKAGQRAAFQVAMQMVAALQREGITPLWEDSGGKGYHLWLCFSESVPASAIRQWAVRWVDQFRPFPEGVLVEIFPKQDYLAKGALGSLIRLPLGYHPDTGRKSHWLTLEGQPSKDDWSILAETLPINPQTLLSDERQPKSGKLDEFSQDLPEPPELIAPMVKGCALIWGLVQKAKQMHHLRHVERLALLYTLGHCGEVGQTYLHQVIALCSNYNPRITERWIQRLDEGHRPIRCSTLREWLKDLLPGVTCSCVPKAKDPTPLDLLQQARETLPKPITSQKEEWEDVAQDMFGDSLVFDDQGHQSVVD
ncbi:CRISPR-associated primase-polymerase type A1 [Fervidibacter sacchari]